MKRYSYKERFLFQVLILQFGGLVAIVISTLLSVLITIGAFLNHATFFSAIWIIAWILLTGWAVGSVMINLYPTIWTSEEGIWISVFWFWRKFVPWSKVIEIRSVNWILSKPSLVRTYSITPVHYLIGWIYGRTLSPGFLIRGTIENFKELLHEIAKKAGDR